MVAHGINTLLVKVLHSVPCKFLFLESRECNIDCFHLVADGVPSLLHNLASFFIRHRRIFTLDLSSSLTLVDTVRTDPFHTRPRLHVTLGLEYLLRCP